MPKTIIPGRVDVEWHDQIYREAGLRAMGPVTVHYDAPSCPHLCGHRLEWIAFQLDPSRQQDLIRSWWEGEGFVGRCPSCGGWIRFRSLGMAPITEEAALRSPRLPDDWHVLAKFA